MPEATEHYRPDIDGLRAVAVLAVVGFHAFPALVPGGFVGVDVFFVISGYLISGLVFRALERGRFSFAGFYGRRVRRIFPALVVVMAALLVFGWFALIADEYRRLARHVSAAAGFALNFVLWRESGYFDTGARLKPLLHLWSLAIEEQFYLAWPGLSFLAWRWSKQFTGLVVGGLALSFAWNVREAALAPSAAFFLPLPRFWELLLGALLAQLDLRPRARAPAAANLASVAGLAALAAALAVIDEERAFSGWWALLPTLGTALVIWAGPAAWPNRVLLARRACVAIGLISYPLYLWHWPLLSLATIVSVGRVAVSTRLWLVALSFALATATYAFVERPIRFGARKPGTPVFGPRERGLVTAMVALACVAVSISAARGVPQRLRETPTREETPFADAECERFAGAENRAFDYCRMKRGSGPELVALIGDSHARSLFPGLSEELASRGLGTVLLASSGCPPLAGTTVGATALDRSHCAKETDEILALASGRAEIRAVVLTVRGALWTSGRGFGDADRNGRATQIASTSPGDPAASGLPAFEAGLRRSVELLQRAGKPVSIVLDVPELGFQPRGCLLRPAWIRPAHACEVERTDVDARQDAYRSAVLELARALPGLEVFDPVSLFCDTGRCRAADGGVLLYDDDDHLSAAGSRLVAALFQTFPAP